MQRTDIDNDGVKLC